MEANLSERQKIDLRAHPPRCRRHGVVMSEGFDEIPHGTGWIMRPNGEWTCSRCEDAPQTTEAIQ